MCLECEYSAGTSVDVVSIEATAKNNDTVITT